MEDSQQIDVNQGAESMSPVDQIAEASASDATIDGDSTANASQQEDGQANSDQSNPNGKDYNWKQMREQVRQLNSQIKALEGAANLEKWLKSNPQNMRVIMDLMDGRPQRQPVQNVQNNHDQSAQVDRWKDYDPETADFLRKTEAELNALKQWKAEWENQQEQQKLTQQEREQQFVQRNMSELDNDFDEALIRDGFMNEDGTHDESLVNMIRDATLSRLTRSHGNAATATRAQMQEAYKAVTAGLAAHQKFTLKKTVQKDVPLSGSTRGNIPTGKTTMSEKDRLDAILSSL